MKWGLALCGSPGSEAYSDTDWACPGEKNVATLLVQCRAGQSESGPCALWQLPGQPHSHLSTNCPGH
jgi:hypothetical protein